MITELAKNEGLDGIVVDNVQLHSGDPGVSGTNNVVASTMTAISLAAASGAVRAMASPLDIPVPATTVSHYSLWGNSGLKSTKAFTTPETYNAPGNARITTAVLTAS